MKIAINAMPSSGYGGITYLRQILPVLDQRADVHQWMVYGRASTLEKIRFDSQKIMFREIRPVGGMLGRLICEQVALPAIFRRDGIDLVYTANNTDLFLAPRPRVIAIRYTEPFVYRNYYNSLSKRVRCAVLKVLTSLSLRSCDHVVCVSEYAQRLALGGSGSEAKSTVIHHGFSKHFKSDVAREFLLPEQFLFCSAKMVGYSNLCAVIEAYALCRRSGVTAALLIAGGSHDANYEAEVRRRIVDLGLTASVRLLGYVGPDEMSALYSGAAVFIFGSLLEACPNTLIEALGCGASIVASDTEPNREIAGDAALWCDGTSAAELATAIQGVLANEELRERLRTRASQRATMFSWHKTADQLVSALESAYSRYEQSTSRNTREVLN